MIQPLPHSLALFQIDKPVPFVRFQTVLKEKVVTRGIEPVLRRESQRPNRYERAPQLSTK